MPYRATDVDTSPEAKRYQAMKNRLFLFNLALNFSFLLVLLFTGWSRALKIWLLNFRDDFFSLNALYLLCFSGIAFLVTFPMDLYEGFILEHRFGLSRQSFAHWLKDLLKKSGIVFVVSLILVEAVYFFLSGFSGHWWLWAAGFWFFVSVVLTRLAPKVLLPVFYRYKPLGDGVLRDRIKDFLSRWNIRLREIYVLDFSKKTVKANAMVAGLGATKQIFLSDTLVAGFSQDEIVSVVAHETGHYLHHDTFKIVLAGLCSALLSFFAAGLVLERLIPVFGFSALSDIAGLPLLAAVLALIGLILLPVQNGFSRFLENKADIFAIEATGDPAGFISLMKRLGEKNFSEFSPSKFIEIFLYDHPPIGRRIELAQRYLLSQG